jgi:hypothetical protein
MIADSSVRRGAMMFAVSAKCQKRQQRKEQLQT